MRDGSLTWPLFPKLLQIMGWLSGFFNGSTSASAENTWRKLYAPGDTALLCQTVVMSCGLEAAQCSIVVVHPTH